MSQLMPCHYSNGSKLEIAIACSQMMQCLLVNYIKWHSSYSHTQASLPLERGYSRSLLQILHRNQLCLVTRVEFKVTVHEGVYISTLSMKDS